MLNILRFGIMGITSTLWHKFIFEKRERELAMEKKQRQR